MKKKSASQSAFFNLRVLVGLLVVMAGVFLALLGFGVFSATAQSVVQALRERKIIKRPRTHSFPLDLTVPRFTSWASTSRKTSGPAPS